MVRQMEAIGLVADTWGKMWCTSSRHTESCLACYTCTARYGKVCVAICVLDMSSWYMLRLAMCQG
jgi:hypothetical protein